MKRIAPALALLIISAACSDTPAPTQPDLPPVAAAISDGAHDGNPHFFFLTPMVPAPSPEGIFDGTVEPTVEICVWNGSECSAGLDYYTTLTGPGSETIRVDLENELYVVNWHTEDILATAPIDRDAGESYRIRVLVGSQVLGHADVAVVAGGNELKNVTTGEAIPLIDGRTLPIKFRIEEGFDDHAGVQGIAAGVWHACAIDAQNDAWCWGWNTYGQLGTGTITGNREPQLVAGGHKWAKITTSGSSTCGLTVDGKAYCWGRNFHGQLGADIPIGGMAPAPVPVLGGHVFRDIATSDAGSHTCGITIAGAALCWGYGRHGQMGNGLNTIDNPAPVPVSGALEFTSISGGNTHTCGLTTSGEGYCWGPNIWGQLGQGSLYWSLTPIAIPGLTFRSLDAGYRHTCGVTTDGDAYCMGYNQYGSAGIGSRLAHVTVPTPVVGGLSFDRISAGGYVTCALQPDGSAWCWGFNLTGAVGNGSLTEAETSPNEVVGGHTFLQIDAGYQFVCGVSSSGEALCWGLNRQDQIGTNYGDYIPSPVNVLDLEPPTP